jgi:hypothetical protein
MYKRPPGNPKVEELNKSHKERSYNLSNLQPIKVTLPGPDPITPHLGQKVTRLCAWCGNGTLKRGNQKYCHKDCSQSAMAWAYPQKEDALGFLLVAQEWKCKGCAYDYLPHMQSLLARERSYNQAPLNELPWWYFKRLKDRVPKERRPEVDHIVPIFKGGQSLGLDNHQAICYTCHKSKTSKDLTKVKPDIEST